MNDLPPYVRALLKHLGESPPGEGLAHVEVRHDSWCRLLNGQGACNCEPVIETGKRIDRKYEGDP